MWEEPWPQADPELLTADVLQLIVQLNGKLIDRLEMPADASEEVQEQIARGSEKLAGAPERQGDREGDRGARASS